MRVNIERVKQKFNKLASIGGTANGGVHRLALSDEDREARNLFVEWLKERELEVNIDDLGNIYGIKKGTDPSLPPLVLGSHLDTVPYGGRFDGTLGVLTGLEIIENLIDENQEHTQSVIVVNFTNEEGARFPKPMISSGVLANKYTTKDMHMLRDVTGKTIKDELDRIGYSGKRENRITKADKFFELHIEQGPALIEQGASAGIVEGIQGLSWHQVTFEGDADHAGPSPMAFRKDAGVGAVKAMYRLHEWVSSAGDETMITFGKIKTEPDVVNVIPGKAVFSVDIRHPDPNILQRRVEEMKQIVIETSLETRLTNCIEDLSYMPPVVFSSDLTEQLEEICLKESIPAVRMYSGAGHDAMYMNRIAETVMVFVPSLNGKSHNEAEESRWEDIESCMNLTAELVTLSLHSRERQK
ncbi:Zn-dependent hydrolase [Alteribacter lacisalsi]|uniref:Zn-dependent hydrolase n=1 Tax=Alteribacter lacisalsi TaxID=2045244 RepID=A0A2W0H5R9_9BACI|nr:Zn-dependent hydrolase [Alteribacter lacisalsi]PYZ97183.1 Zn-dependent hydrolase [Alteribacter lacisalsi]